jgi:hypothetical protein
MRALHDHGRCNLNVLRAKKDWTVPPQIMMGIIFVIVQLFINPQFQLLNVLVISLAPGFSPHMDLLYFNVALFSCRIQLSRQSNSKMLVMTRCDNCPMAKQ